MDSEYLNSVKCKIQRRFQRLNNADWQVFHIVLKHVWQYLIENSITKCILEDLEKQFPQLEMVCEEIIDGQPKMGDSERENSAICYWIIKKCVASDYSDQMELRLGLQVSRIPSTRPSDDAEEVQNAASIKAFLKMYIEPLFDYIDEQIDDKRVILFLLKKFKEHCEWFQRKTMQEEVQQNTQQGEKCLANSLYSYLHDQGIQFQIEPQSASGRVDLISNQSGKDRLVADAKIFNPERGQDRGYIIKGFRQIYDYTKDYNESFGYLVIFKTCEQDLAIPMEHQESSFPFITHNNKTIFFVVIDLFDYPESASKRGKLKAYEITPQQFVEELEKEKNSSITDMEASTPVSQQE